MGRENGKKEKERKKDYGPGDGLRGGGRGWGDLEIWGGFGGEGVVGALCFVWERGWDRRGLGQRGSERGRGGERERERKTWDSGYLLFNLGVK